jgi:serine/threonine protein kinase
MRLLGRGGFANVYLAWRADIRKLCAIKVIKKDKVRQEKQQTQVLRERLVLTLASR